MHLSGMPLKIDSERPGWRDGRQHSPIGLRRFIKQVYEPFLARNADLARLSYLALFIGGFLISLRWLGRATSR